MTTPREELAIYTTQSQMSSFFIDKMGIVNVKSYGAKGDGITDDTTAIRNAFNAGSYVHFPDDGTYVCSGKLEPNENQIIMAYGATLKMAASFTSTENLLEISSSGVKIYGMKINGNKSNLTGSFASGSVGCGIIIKAGGSDFYGYDIRIDDCISNGFLVYGSGVTNINLKDTYVNGCAITGCAVEIPQAGDTIAKTINWDNVIVKSNTLGGFYIAGAENLTMDNCRSLTSGSLAGYFYVGDAGGRLKNCKVTNCYFQTSNNAVNTVEVQGKIQDGALTGTYKDCDVEFVNCDFEGNNGAYGLYVDGKSNAKLVNCCIEETAIGIGNVDSSLVICYNTDISNVTSHGILAGAKIKLYNLSVKNFGTTASNQAAIVLNTGSDYSVIVDCQLGNPTAETGEVGIWNLGDVTYCRVISNSFDVTTTNIDATIANTATWIMLDNENSTLDSKLGKRGTTAPATGTWEVGDYVRNSNPSVGQPKGWYCTVAGAPGTWVSEGNL